MNDGLRHIHITGFASLADVHLEPGRMTVLIGPNGAGKSNILRALRMVPLMRTATLQRFVSESGGAAALLHGGPSRTQALRVRLDFVQGARRNVYEARLGCAAGDKLIYLDESVGYQPAPDAQLRTVSLGAGHWESALRSAKAADATARALNFWLSQLTFYHVHDTSMSSALRTPARAEDDQFLRSDGSNLAAYLYRLQQSDDDDEMEAWRRISGYVRRIAPAVRELVPTPIGASALRLEWIDDRGLRLGPHQLSDGTLRAIALITAFAQPPAQRPRFVSIDEPELGLDPAGLHVVAELARSVSERTQVLVATHSTAFLDHVTADEVVLVERDEGGTTLRRLDEDALDAWLDEYDAGVERERATAEVPA